MTMLLSQPPTEDFSRRRIRPDRAAATDAELASKSVAVATGRRGPLSPSTIDRSARDKRHLPRQSTSRRQPNPLRPPPHAWHHFSRCQIIFRQERRLSRPRLCAPASGRPRRPKQFRERRVEGGRLFGVDGVTRARGSPAGPAVGAVRLRNTLPSMQGSSSSPAMMSSGTENFFRSASKSHSVGRLLCSIAWSSRGPRRMLGEHARELRIARVDPCTSGPAAFVHRRRSPRLPPCLSR